MEGTDDIPDGTRSAATRSGIRWMLANTVASKLLNAVAYVVLGWLLTDREFGVYAFVLGLGFFAQAFQDRGVKEILVSQGRACFPTLWPSALAYGVGLNVGAALGLVGIGSALIVSSDSSYSSDHVLTLLFVALSIPLSAPWAVMSARLSMEFCFDVIAKVTVLSMVVQYSGAIALALLGMGPMSLGASLAAGAAVRGSAGALLLRSEPRTSQPRRPSQFLGASGWVIVAALGFGTFQQGDYLVAGLLLPASVVGLYYFAYQAPFQIVSLLGSSLHSVLLPWMSLAHKQSEREAFRGIHTSSQLLVLSTTIAGSILALTIPFIEALLWRGRWVDAVLPIQILALFMPMRALVEPPKALLLGGGEFRRWAFQAMTLGCATLVGAALGSFWGGDAVTLSLGVGAATTLAVLVLWGRVAASVADPKLVLSSLRQLCATYLMAAAPAWLLLVAIILGPMESKPTSRYFSFAVLAFASTVALLLWQRRGQLGHLLRLAAPHLSAGKSR